MSDTSYYGLYGPLDGSDDDRPVTRLTVHADENRLAPPATETASGVERAVNRLLGINGEERYQTWPERMVRSGFTLPHDVMTGQEPTTAVDPITGETVPAPHMLERTQDLAGMAMSGGLAGAAEGGRVVGSGPVRTSTMRNSEIPTATAREQQLLRKAVRESGDDRPFDKHPRQEVPIKDLVATQDEVSQEIVQQKIQGGEYKGDNNAFAVLHDGKYYIEDGHHTVEAARRMGRDTVPMHVQQLNTKNEAAALLSALEKRGPIWHSPVENALEQSTTGSAPGKQWLATLQNARGVKPEELDWTGLRDFLTERADQKVTRQELHEQMARNKVQLQDVEKGGTFNEIQKPKFEDLTYGQVRDLRGAHEQYEGSTKPSDADLRSWYNELNEGDLRSMEMPWAKSVADTEYHDYQLPGGENYREHLLTLPEKKSKYDEFMKLGASLNEKYPGGRYDSRYLTSKERARLTPEELRSYDELVPYYSLSFTKNFPQPYLTSHWDEPNVIAHVRTNDRMIDGKKALHIEEVQSDWHQQGRKKGYRPAGQGDYVYNDNMDVIGNNQGKVPDAPFKTTWPELAMKRMIRRAAEEGYDRISWTPGEAQAARYDLSRQIKVLQYQLNKDGKSYTLKGETDKGGIHDFGDSVPSHKLADYVGKDVAQKIIDDTNNVGALKGADLKVGGDGMREFYDKMLPRVAEKIGKAHGVKVQRGSLPGGSDNFSGGPKHTPPARVYEALTQQPGFKEEYPTVAKFVSHWNELNSEHRLDLIESAKTHGSTPVHYFDIPQSLRDQALQKGMPLFSGGKMFIPATAPPDKENKK